MSSGWETESGSSSESYSGGGTYTGDICWPYYYTNGGYPTNEGYTGYSGGYCLSFMDNAYNGTFQASGGANDSYSYTKDYGVNASGAWQGTSGSGGYSGSGWTNSSYSCSCPGSAGIITISNDVVYDDLLTIPLWNNDYYEETLNGPIRRAGTTTPPTASPPRPSISPSTAIGRRAAA